VRFKARGEKGCGESSKAGLMGFIPRRPLVAFLFAVGAVLAAAPGFSAGAAKPAVALAVTRMHWTFDPGIGVMVLDGEVANVSKVAVEGPGVIVTLLDMNGNEITSVYGNGRTSVLQPGGRTKVYAVVVPPSVPAAVEIRTVEGMGRT
jgi:hypothetical protein